MNSASDQHAFPHPNHVKLTPPTITSNKADKRNESIKKWQMGALRSQRHTHWEEFPEQWHPKWGSFPELEELDPKLSNSVNIQRKDTYVGIGNVKLIKRTFNHHSVIPSAFSLRYFSKQKMAMGSRSMSNLLAKKCRCWSSHSRSPTPYTHTALARWPWHLVYTARLCWTPTCIAVRWRWGLTCHISGRATLTQEHQGFAG